MFIFSSLYNNAFLTSFNIKGMLIESSFMTLLAMGMTFVILTGGIDLSVGSIAGLSSVVLTLIMKHWKLGNDLLVILIAVVLSLLLCTALGLINGIFVTKLRLPPLIVTLGMTWVASGLGNALLKGVPLALSISAYKKALEIKVLDWIPITFIIVLTLLILQAYVLKSFRWGREFYAVGSNRYAAFISGTKTSSVLRRAYMLSGLLAGLAGLLIAAYTGSGYPAAARNYELYTIAAVVMGGISLTGGEGKVFLAFFGVIVLRLLNKLVVFTGLSSISGFIEGIIVGSLLIIVLLINTLRKGEETK
jgi:ribose transport system permease protein